MQIVDFLLQIGKLKRLKRTGWVKNNIPNPETVAEHSFRTAVMAAILSEQLGLDQLKAIKMALFHDIGEAEIGDLITYAGKKVLPNLQEKIAKERSGFAKIFSIIGKKEMVDLYDEFEEKKTPEAKLVKELDKLEAALQAYEYEKEHKVDLEEFFENGKLLIQSGEIKQILEEIENLRK